MTRLLVPIDFSATAINAAKYAGALANAIGNAQMVLFNVPAPGSIGSDGTPIVENDIPMQHAVQHSLKELQVKLFDATATPTDVLVRSGDFIEQLNLVLAEQSFDFVVMGISGASALQERFLGSFVTDIIEKTNVPVLAVPPGAVFKQMKRAALAVELKDVALTVPGSALNAWLTICKPDLDIVSVNPETYIELTEEQKAEQEILQSMFATFRPQFTNLGMFDFADAINTHVDSTGIDVVIVIPKKHGLLAKLFNESHTKKLAFHSHVPVLAVHSL